jgi:hypothetical protein
MISKTYFFVFFRGSNIRVLIEFDRMKMNVCHIYGPASIEYSFASGFYAEDWWRPQVACSCQITVLRVPSSCVLSFSWLVDVTDGRVVSLGAHLAFTAAMAAA